MQPGELRQVSTGTVITYTLGSGNNQLRLAPRFVAAAHLITVTPLRDRVAAGGTARYELTLTNPGAATTYELGLLGIPAEWADVPAEVAMPTGKTITVPVHVNVPIDTVDGALPFVVTVTTADARDQAPAPLTVIGPRLSITPALREVPFGTVLSYTLTLTNPAGAETFTFAVNGLDSATVQLPNAVTVAAGETIETTLVVTATAAAGFASFRVQAQPTQGDAAEGTAALAIAGGPALQSVLDPALVSAGPGSTAAFTLTLTNDGTLIDVYDLAVETPVGWSGSVQANGAQRSTVRLLPFVFNRSALQLIVAVPDDAVPGSYPVRVIATSSWSATVQAVAVAKVVVGEHGVQVALTPRSASAAPGSSQTWRVQVRNSGSVADRYDLTLGGTLAINTQLSQTSVSIEPGASMSVDLRGGPPVGMLPSGEQLVVTAQSQAEPSVHDSDAATLAVSDMRGVAVALDGPDTALRAESALRYGVVVSNTGNVETTYDLIASSTAQGVKLELELGSITVPAQLAAALVLDARLLGQQPIEQPFRIYLPLLRHAPAQEALQRWASVADQLSVPGTYEITVRAIIRGSTDSASDSAPLRIDATTIIFNEQVYLPMVRR
jgi:hypothetical protein